VIPTDLLIFALCCVSAIAGWIIGYREGYGDASKWFRVNIERMIRGKEPIEDEVIEGSELAAVERDE